jgi:D-alanyl-D-alanine dipeptidase
VRRWAGLAVLLALAGCGSGAATSSAPVRPPIVSTPARPATGSPTTPPLSTTATAARPPSRTASATGSPAAAPTGTHSVPPLSAAARAAGLLDIRTLVPDAVVDLRYATTHNFVGVRLYPHDARCLVHRTMAHGLVVAARQLRRAGYLLVFWDCYRPHAVQVRMYENTPNPDWVARPGPYAYSHEAARSVDVTLAWAAPRAGCPTGRRDHGHCLLDMGTGFDDFTPRAYAYATDGVSALARANRALLRHAMAAGGLSVYSGEWWHFDGPGAGVRRPILHVPLR